jgi:hypothetical protein
MMRFKTLSGDAALAACAMLAMTLAGCSSAKEPEPQVLAISGMANATPSIAASGDFVTVAWGASDASGSTDVYAAVSRDGGATFSPPVRVNDEDGGANLNGEQPPRVTLTDRADGAPGIAVVWTAKTAEGTRLLLSRSQDGGRSFGSDFVVPGTEAAGNRGWQSSVVAGGRVNVLWLDHREMAAGSTIATSHHEHAASAEGTRDGVAMAQKSKLYFATADGAIAPQAITGGVCYCCKTTLAAGSNGSIYAAWRQVYAGNIRDIAFTMSSDGGRTFAPPIRVSEDGWVLDGCPENGPAMLVDRGQRVHVVWPTLVGAAGSDDEALALFYAASRDGRQFTPRQQLATEGVPRHVQIAMAPGGALVVAWDEAANGTRHVAIARGTPDANGQVTFQRESTDDVEGTYPVLAATTNGIVTAWTSGSASDSVIRVGVRPQ